MIPIADEVLVEVLDVVVVLVDAEVPLPMRATGFVNCWIVGLDCGDLKSA